MTQDARVAGLALALGHQGEPGRLGEHADRAGGGAISARRGLGLLYGWLVQWVGSVALWLI